MNVQTDAIKAPTILIIDDEEGLRNILFNRLLRLGFRVEVAVNGLHALQKIKSGLIPTVILCDLKMPGMGGFEFMKSLREDLPESDIPIIVITGYPERDLVRQTKRLGVRSILVKPFSFQDIFNRIVEEIKMIAA